MSLLSSMGACVAYTARWLLTYPPTPCGLICYGSKMPDLDGAVEDVVLGYDSADEYRNNGPYLGVVSERQRVRFFHSGARAHYHPPHPHTSHPTPPHPHTPQKI
jgi:hypothetical protein